MLLDLNSQSRTGERINWFLDRAMQARELREPVRDYLGLSYLGGECPRQAQYTYLRQQDDLGKQQAGNSRDCHFGAQQLRRFQRGHVMEDVAAQWLREAGFSLLTLDPATGGQWEVDLLGDGRALGHADGIITGHYSRHGACPLAYPLLWECKCLASSPARAIKKKGLRKEHPKYFDQVQGLMGGLSLSGAVFTVINADTMEVDHYLIDAAPKEYPLLQSRARMILRACGEGRLVPRGMDKASDYRCKMCSHHAECWEG